MRFFIKIWLLITILFLMGCSWIPEKTVYQTVYVKPDIRGLQNHCSVTTLEKPIDKPALISMKNDEARFIYISGLYTQALGAYGKCINETKGIVIFVREIDQERKSEESKPPPK